MKKFIAVAGNTTSGDPKSREKALEWAKNFLQKGGKATVFLTECVSVVEHEHPPVMERPFVVELEKPEELKPEELKVA